MKIATLQLNSQGLSSTKLYKYIRIAHKNGVKVLVFGEYILNPFFKGLEKMPINMIKKQAKYQIKILLELSATYDITIVAPIVTVKKEQIYKSTIKFSPSSTAYYNQQVLINYPYWNEEKYFSNEISTLKTPLIFNTNGIKFAIINGFEIHFDELWEKVYSKNIDCILVPSLSTFESNNRWSSIIVSRAFTNNCYILRANRIGDYKDKDNIWKFYGNSMLVSPNGEILDTLGNKEGLMISSISHLEVKKARKLWGFKEHKRKRGSNARIFS